MHEALFTGACTAMVTPFLGEKINYPLMKQLLRRQIDAGIRAVVISGTTGESPTLSDREKLELFTLSKDFCGSDCKVIAGTGSNSTEHTIELSQAAEEVGVDGLLVVTPYYNKGNTDGLYAHYMHLAHSVKIPIIIYNVPSRTGADMSVNLYERLSRFPNIVGVKEASNDITKIAKIRQACTGGFSVWSGNDDQTVPVMSLGGLGVISVLSNVCPVETAAMADAALAGDFDSACALQCRLLPLINLLFSEVNPVPVKYAMSRIGYDCGDCRLPLGRISKDVKMQIDAYFS